MPPSRLPWMRMLSHSIAVALQTEIRGRDRGAIEILGRCAQRQATLLKTVEAHRSVERAVDVLLDHDDGDAFSSDDAKALIDVADDDRSQPEGELIAKQQPRIGH